MSQSSRCVSFSGESDAVRMQWSAELEARLPEWRFKGPCQSQSVVRFAQW